MTHRDLVLAGKKWLSRNGCSVVVTEVASASNETPDVIGFRYNQSVLIEVKMSRSDFLADKKKLFRQFQPYGMGNYRYYLAPKGVLQLEDMPDKWFLLEYKNRRIYGNKPHLKTSNNGWQPSNIANEKILLQSVCRRVAFKYGDLDNIIHAVNASP